MAGVPLHYDMALLVAIAVASVVGMSHIGQLPPHEAWAQADADTVRLRPSEVPALPPALRAELERRGCTIPQTHAAGPPHNVIRGRFRADDTVDVAVLCSRRGESSILVFWAGDPHDSSEMPPRPDAAFLQVIAPGRIGFSRAIAVASAQSIREYQARDASANPPPLSHDGIDDSFVEKASAVWYWHQGTWLRLAGAD